jgi:hypothetical protein
MEIALISIKMENCYLICVLVAGSCEKTKVLEPCNLDTLFLFSYVI